MGRRKRGIDSTAVQIRSADQGVQAFTASPVEGRNFNLFSLTVSRPVNAVKEHPFDLAVFGTEGQVPILSVNMSGSIRGPAHRNRQ